jgi:ubiquinone/menaquinone biosynthesis C-methylase UbiE
LDNLIYIALIDHRWVEGEATDLPFQDCYFDAIPIGYGFRKCGGLAEGLAGDV